MAEEFETVELEYSEDDILYYLVDEDGNEVGFVIEEDGREVECYFEEEPSQDGSPAGEPAGSGKPEAEYELVELEYSEDDIVCYLVDEDDNEVGFVIEEDGVEVECYYEGDGSLYELADSQPAETGSKSPEEPKERGYLSKVMAIAGHEGNKARKKAEVHLDKVRSKAEEGVDKATEVVEEKGKKLKKKSDETDLGITREGIAETTADLNVIAKEGAATAKEFKETYDDIMESFGFLVPKKIRRRLP